MDKKHLFRQEAIQHVKNKYYGSVYINIPIPYSMVTISLCLLIIGLLSYLSLANFSEKYTVKGYLNADKGIINVYPTQDGIISQCHFTQGQLVKRGDVLCTIRKTYDNFGTHRNSAELEQLEKRKASIQQDIAHKTIHLRALKSLLTKKYIAWQTYQTAYDEISALQNNLHQIKMTIIQYQHAQTYRIRAPISGTIANVMYQTGQYVTEAKPLLHILPKDTHLLAQLYVPVAKSGFLNLYDPIAIRYDAYPYQLFGIATGKIQQIGRTILTDAEESKPFQLHEPYYKLIASLDKETISLNGKARSLQQGMTFSAVITGTRKKIWQWILH